MDLPDNMKFFHEVFHPSLPRLGPGRKQDTQRALDLFFDAGELPFPGDRGPRPRVMDLGCGNGAQTLSLLQATDWDITAIDRYEPFLAELRQRASAGGFEARVTTLERDMTRLDFEPGSFDIIWSEGALYSMGVAPALETCHRLLASDGLLAFSELCWLKESPSTEAKEYFAQVYPDIRSVEENLRMIDTAGFERVGLFELPAQAWWDDFYLPLGERARQLASRAAGVPALAEVIAEVEAEIDVYRRNQDEYGYVFYCLKKG